MKTHEESDIDQWGVFWGNPLSYNVYYCVYIRVFGGIFYNNNIIIKFLQSNDRITTAFSDYKGHAEDGLI